MNPHPFHVSTSGRAVMRADTPDEAGMMVARCYTKREARALRDLLNAMHVLAVTPVPHIVGEYERPGVVPVSLREKDLWLQLRRVARQAVAASAHLGIPQAEGGRQ